MSPYFSVINRIRLKKMGSLYLPTRYV